MNHAEAPKEPQPQIQITSEDKLALILLQSRQTQATDGTMELNDSDTILIQEGYLDPLSPKVTLATLGKSDDFNPSDRGAPESTTSTKPEVPGGGSSGPTPARDAEAHRRAVERQERERRARQRRVRQGGTPPPPHPTFNPPPRGAPSSAGDSSTRYTLPYTLPGPLPSYQEEFLPPKVQ